MTKKQHTANRFSKEVIKRVGSALLLASTSACSGVMANNIGEDTLLIYGNENSLRAWSDRDSGLITNGKATPDAQDTPYYELRRMDTQMRLMKPQRAKRVAR